MVQRKKKLKKSREQAEKSIKGSILKFVCQCSNTSDQGQGECSTSTSIGLEVPAAVEEELAAPQEGEDYLSEQDPENSVNAPPQQSDEQHEGLVMPQTESADGDSTDGVNIDTLLLDSDVGNWPIPVTDGLRIDIVKRGSEYFQNREGPFESVQRTGTNLKGLNRQLTTNWFYKHLPNGEKVLRKWMVYSPSKKSLFCFCCKLFNTDEKTADTSKFITGFQNWWKLNPKVSLHENSDQHLSNLEKWKTLGSRLLHNKTIDCVQQEVLEGEKKSGTICYIDYLISLCF